MIKKELKVNANVIRAMMTKKNNGPDRIEYIINPQYNKFLRNQLDTLNLRYNDLDDKYVKKKKKKKNIYIYIKKQKKKKINKIKKKKN